MTIDARIPVNIHPIIMAVEKEIEVRNFKEGILENEAFSLVHYMNLSCELSAEEHEDSAETILKERNIYSKENTYINQIASFILWCQARVDPTSCDERLLRHEFRATILTKSREVINQLSAKVLPALPQPTMLENIVEKVKALWNNYLFKAILGFSCFCFRVPLGKAIENKVNPLVKLTEQVLPERVWQVLQIAANWTKAMTILAVAFQQLTPSKSLMNRAVIVVHSSLLFYGSLVSDRINSIVAMSRSLSVRCSMREDRDQELEEFFITNARSRA